MSVGTVITSATGAFSGGTTLLKMADLGQVRIRALFNETDIGQVQPGQPATVTVDAYPDRRFSGVVEKIEPQAVVQQNVTMFPVLVTLENLEGLLKPGMNGETSVLVDQRDDVLAVPNDAVRNPREAAATAPMLGLDAGLRCARSMRDADGGARRWTAAAQRQGGDGAGGAGARRRRSRGDVARRSRARTAGRQGGGGGRAGGRASRCPTSPTQAVRRGHGGDGEEARAEAGEARRAAAADDERRSSTATAMRTESAEDLRRASAWTGASPARAAGELQAMRWPGWRAARCARRLARCRAASGAARLARQLAWRRRGAQARRSPGAGDAAPARQAARSRVAPGLVFVKKGETLRAAHRQLGAEQLRLHRGRERS